MYRSEKLTIVLPMKGRLDFVLRWLDYANLQKFPFKIVIADGSEDDCAMDYFGNNRQFENINYEYIRFPVDVDYSVYYKKIKAVLSSVSTPYVVMADNDDFFSVDGLISSIEFLEKNTQYVASRGDYLGFSVQPFSSSANELYGEMQIMGLVYQSISYTDHSSANRLKHYFNEWTPTWYNVTRTDVLKLGWEIVSTENIKNIFLQEHLLGGYLATQGKLHSGSYSYYYRQLDASAPSVTKTEVENNGDFFDRMLLETWSSDYEAFQRVLSQAIFDKDGVPYETARTIVQKAYRTFVAPVILDALTSELHRRKTLPMHVMFAFRKVKAVVSPATKLLKSFLSRENYRLDSNTMKVKSFLKASNHDLHL